MNLSSLVITLQPNTDIASISEQISKYASIEVKEGDKIVAVVESDDTDGQIKAYRALERIDGVANVAMIYSYEDPADVDALGARSMDEIMDKLEKTPTEKANSICTFCNCNFGFFWSSNICIKFELCSIFCNGRFIQKAL